MASADPIVYIVDDDESIRCALDSLLRSVGTATRQFGTTQDFLQATRAEVPSALVLDIRLPGTGGLDFQQFLNDHGIAIPVVFMTGHGDIPMTVRGMKAGAVDFLTKPFRDQDMLDAIGRALERDRSRRASVQQGAELRARFESLTARERQVMAWVTAGRMNKQAAGELGISEITVKIHRGNAMRKMGARTLADLVRMASELKLAPERSEPR